MLTRRWSSKVMWMRSRWLRGSIYTENIEDEDGLTGAVFAYQWVRSNTDIEGEISSTYTMTDDDEGKAIQVRVTFSDDAGNEESLTSYARLSAPPPAQQDDDGPAVVVNFGSAAHSVTEGSTVKVEVEVTLDVDPERTVTVPLTVTDQDGASPADYSGVPSSVTFDSGEVLKTFTFSATRDDVDDDGESVKLTFGTLPARVSAGTVSESTVNIQSKTPLTASVESAPPSHNGSDEFRIRIAFSEEPKTGFSYKIMRDHAFTVTGGSVTGARRLVKGSNIGWEIVVKSDSNGDVTITLPATTDCDAQGAILRRRRQEAVQPAGDNRQRAGRIGRGRKSGRAAGMAGQGRPSRQSAPEQAERQAWRVLVMVLKAKLEAVEAGITTITGFQEQDIPTNKGPEKQIGKDDVAAGAAGAAAGAGLGGLGGAGLAIGGGAIAIPAVAVVAVPAVAVGAVAFGAWKVAKAFRKKSR